jgi:3D (Asp-Asp-Asp) domain-containing protein
MRRLAGPMAALAIATLPDWRLKATLYHAGAAGVGSLDSIGCKPIAMRTAATDPRQIPRRTVLFIKETVGLDLPDGSKHDGFWYASDVGGAIKGDRIDLYTGSGKGSSGRPGARATWMPHSVLSCPAQRPARRSSPSFTGLVQGQQPMDGKPCATSGWAGRSCSAA